MSLRKKAQGLSHKYKQDSFHRSTELMKKVEKELQKMWQKITTPVAYGYVEICES